MGATISTLGNVMKDLYKGPVREQLNNEVWVLQNLVRGTGVELVGTQAVIPLHTGRTAGIGSRAENGTLPTAGNQVYNRAVFDLKYHYGVIEVTGPSMAKTKNDAGAFLKALESEMEGVLVDLKLDLARQFYGDGTARIAACGVTTASTTVVMGSNEMILKGFIYPGMVITIGTSANPDSVTAGARTVTSVDETAGTFVISGAVVTTAVTDFVFRSGSAAAGVSFEMDGLDKLVSTAATTVGGINETGNSFWAPQRVTGTSLTLNKLQEMDNRVRIKGGKSSIKLTSLGIQNQYFNLLQTQVRYTDPMNLKSGYQVLEHNGLPVFADHLAPFGKIYGLDQSRMFIVDNEDWHWLDEDGDVLKWVVGKDAWTAAITRYMNLATDARNVHSVFSGITDNGVT